jgi:hypothetical protein
MLNHKFSEDLPIKELMNSYLGIDIEGKSLDTILSNMATIIDVESSKLQPTTAQHTYHRMKMKFNYLIGELGVLKGMNNNDTEEIRKNFWKLVGELSAVRRKNNYQKTLDLISGSTGLRSTNNSNITTSNENREVYLFERDTIGETTHTYAQLSNEDLLIEYWRFDEDKEEACTIKISSSGKRQFCIELGINPDDDLLLNTLPVKFNSENSIWEIETFLKDHVIEYSMTKRHVEH